MAHPTHKHRGNRRLLALFLLVLVAVTSYVLRVSKPSGFKSAESSAQAGLESLYAAAKSEPVEKFLDRKNSFQKSVTAAIQTKGTESPEYQWAVYFFPDTLPSGDLEKSVGLELWAPLQEQIEKAPRSTASRAIFEDLRATVWNYENPDRNDPNLSDAAQGMIRIYDALSEPTEVQK